MSDHRQEQLAVELAALATEQREWVHARMRELLKAKRSLGNRLLGRPQESKWGRVVTGEVIFDADGAALCRVKHVDIRIDTNDYNGTAVKRIYITAVAEGAER